MAKEFKNGERVEFRPWETAPAKDRVAGKLLVAWLRVNIT